MPFFGVSNLNERDAWRRRRNMQTFFSTTLNIHNALEARKRMLQSGTKTKPETPKNDDNDFLEVDLTALCHRLPQDIVINNILTRIPIENLLSRFRCVSKQWANTIFDPTFAEHYSRQSNYNPPGFLCHSTDIEDDDDKEQGRSRLVFFDLNKRVERDIPFRPENDFLRKKIKVLHSLNGLLLIYCEDEITKMQNFRVYNPITRRSKILPMLIQDVVSKIKCHFCLAYDSITTNYKVVCSGYNTTKHEYFCKILTIGVEGDSYWRDLVVPEPQFLLPQDYPPVFANGSLYWKMSIKDFTNVDGTNAESERGILSMDVSRETFYAISNPNCYSGGLHTLIEMGGLLCFVDHISQTQLKLWVLKAASENNGDQHEDWMEECSIDMGHLQSILPFIGFQYDCCPYAFLKHPRCSSKFIFWNCISIGPQTFYKYYSYDLELKQLEFIYEPAEGGLSWHVNTLTYI